MTVGASSSLVGEVNVLDPETKHVYLINSRQENKPHLDETRFGCVRLFWIFHVNRSQMRCDVRKLGTLRTSVFPVQFFRGGVVIKESK